LPKNFYFYQKGFNFAKKAFFPGQERLFYDIYRTPTKFPVGLKVKRTAQVTGQTNKNCERFSYCRGGTKYYKDMSNFPEIKHPSKKMLYNTDQEQLQFSRRKNA